jgi:putative ABC transport system permease protein
VRDWAAFVRAHLRLTSLTPERESRIVREVAAQLEDFYRDALASGRSDDEADAQARAQIADWGQMARDVERADRLHAKTGFDRVIEPRLESWSQQGRTAVGRSRGGPHVFSNMIRDAHYAIRQLRRTPGFTAVAIVTLALGIGATSTIFSVVNGVLLRPLPYPSPNGLVRVYEIVPRFGRFSNAPATFLDWRQQNTVFEHIVATNSTGATFDGGSGPERVSGLLVSWDLFDLLQVRPALGRSFRAEEDAPGKDAVIVISHPMWQLRFGSDPNVLGRSITLSGTPVTIIGVMPAGFAFGDDVEFWRPLALNPANATRGGHFLATIARLKPGVTVEQAHAEIKGLSERLAVQYPMSANESAEVVGMHQAMVAGIRPALLTLLAAVGVVILIACANVANLLLVRASVRGKEIAIRTALGASRWRLVRQMLAESLVLSLAGGAAGLLLTYLAIGPIQTLSANGIPRSSFIAIDRTVLLFAFGVSMLTAVLFGLAPAWQASRARVGVVLKEGGRSSAASGGRWMRNVLLVAEVAMSIVLLVGAVLLLRSFSRLVNVDPGFKPDHVLAFRVALPNGTYPEEHQRITFYETLASRLESLPDVTSAGGINVLPMRGSYILSFKVRGRPEPTPNEGTSANYRAIMPGYFQAMGVPLLRGRTFTVRDAEKAPMVAIIDQQFADRYFPGEDPVGQGMSIGNGTEGFYEIVGVVGGVRQSSLEAQPGPTMYVAYPQSAFSGMWIVVRTKSDPVSLAAAVRQTVREIDSNLPAFSLTPLTTVISDSVAQRRFLMLVLTVFASIALFLAAVGLYGVVAYMVSQRTQEIGLRMAIGAQRGDVLQMILGGGMKLAIVGVAIGLVAALSLSSVMSTMLYEIERFDPSSYIVTALILLAIAALACYVPARRAIRVDPIVALRE